MLDVVPMAQFSEDCAARIQAGLETLLGPGVAVSARRLDRIAPEPSRRRLVIEAGPVSG